MDRDVDLGRASREELIQLVGRLLDHVEALEARISELAGRPKPPTEPPTEGGKERKPPSWVKANRPDLPRKERQKRAHGFARRREEPTHRVEHATASCPDCGTVLLGGRVRRRRQIITIPRVRARVTEHVVLERTCRKCGQQWSPELGLGRPRGKAATGGNLSPAGSMRAPGGVPASLWGDSTLPEVALQTGP